MATLVFTTLGTALGGPLGGLAGGLIGRHVDAALLGGRGRTASRLDDLRVSTSSYGSAIARHYGRIRVPGSIIWSTDLVEHAESEGGGKGGSATAYRYSASFAVALSSRPIDGVRRIWADGNLLRGAAGDLKAGGVLRVYPGHGDQPVDPLLASALGEQAPAHRGIAYAVFEDLDLSGFGNRIPALSFEILAQDDATQLAPMLAGLSIPAEIDLPLPGLAGFSHEGGPVTQLLEAIGAAYPLACDAGGEALSIRSAERIPADPPLLPEPAAAQAEGSSGQAGGRVFHRAAEGSPGPGALRYYDVERDYLAGMQRAGGQARPGMQGTLEFPGALLAADALALIDAAAERSRRARETVAWRVAELDPAMAPGGIVRLPGMAGFWRITGWEWREEGVELELLRLPHGGARQVSADPGQVNSPPDLVAGPTRMVAAELPWDGTGAGDRPVIAAAVSASGAGWAGASLFVDRAGELVPLGEAGRRRTILGELETALPPSPGVLLERDAALAVTLVSTDLALSSVGAAGLASGLNRALVGGEVLQFARATALGEGQWLVEGLLRGRAGTEAAAMAGHPPGAAFVLLDDTLRLLDPQIVGSTGDAVIAALGRGDAAPVTAPIGNPGLTLRPPCPVNAASHGDGEGGLTFTWTRRARGAWAWRDGVETPLVEETESYAIGLGPVGAPHAQWQAATPSFTLAAADIAALAADHPGAPLWVRQAGTYALSDPLLLATLP